MCLEIASFAYTSDGKEFALGQIIQIVVEIVFQNGQSSIDTLRSSMF